MAGVSKAYTLPFDYVLYEMSYANVIMYSAVLPSYGSGKGGQGGAEQKVIKADDPKNREAVKKFFEQCD